jgi:methylated-DNA-[protein]-cysteine S-methyltransferase
MGSRSSEVRWSSVVTGLERRLQRAIRDPAGANLTRLHARLVERAETSGALDVAYRTVDSPLGPLLVAATPAGVVRVSFGLENPQDVLEALAADVSPRMLEGGRRLDAVCAQLDGYFGGRLHHFDVPVDLQLVHGFRRQVLQSLLGIPYGRTASYRDVARSAGSAGAVRAAGTACATNPIPILVPCHRVVRSDGAIGGYRGGVEAKRWLLDLESV